MRLVAFAGSFAFLAALATFACSSSDSTGSGTDATDAGGGLDGLVRDPRDDGPSGPITELPPEPDAGEGDADKEPPVVTGDAGTKCKPGSTVESEANNDTATADPFTVKTGDNFYCGRIEAGADVDVFTFSFPPADGEYAFGFGFSDVTDELKVEATFNGTPFAFGGGPGSVPGGAGGVYVLKLSSPTGKQVDYSIKVSFQP